MKQLNFELRSCDKLLLLLLFIYVNSHKAY